MAGRPLKFGVVNTTKRRQLELRPPMPCYICELMREHNHCVMLIPGVEVEANKKEAVDDDPASACRQYVPLRPHGKVTC